MYNLVLSSIVFILFNPPSQQDGDQGQMCMKSKDVPSGGLPSQCLVGACQKALKTLLNQLDSQNKSPLLYIYQRDRGEIGKIREKKA